MTEKHDGMKGADMSNKTTIGFLRRGDFFLFEGVRYKVGRLIEGTNGYVNCVDTVSKKVKRLYIDTTVEAVKKPKGEEHE